ncbi:MAG: hypothetical protein SVK08_00420 [Halobacteriota archaeon]|nr:hypothetical protein [Halobacteriota archaeon]
MRISGVIDRFMTNILEESEKLVDILNVGSEISKDLSQESGEQEKRIYPRSVAQLVSKEYLLQITEDSRSIQDNLAGICVFFISPPGENERVVAAKECSPFPVFDPSRAIGSGPCITMFSDFVIAMCNHLLVCVRGVRVLLLSGKKEYEAYCDAADNDTYPESNIGTVPQLLGEELSSNLLKIQDDILSAFNEIFSELGIGGKDGAN